ncbi:TIGR03618 family F420-dependent PPOX class oxidoreductase [Mycolicibacterium sp. CBMA 234]|uniref:TIGR03618 family F420-dependent PPOX class oxidoreductase n=1 Tax=Mycolicibacterium sp. CBMA 234 TaxID=1918495 RepID=UPI00139164CA|nr:TIGR03618 family F420-dependent PPOX class oxidoreductase [Mycolicibacterium sp. CBMA 234]
MTDVAAFAELSAQDHGLVVLNTLRGDGSIQSSVVNAGVMPHPKTGEQVVALVAIGATRKLRNLRADPRASVVAHAGWQWMTVEGTTEVIGADDADAEELRLLLRAVFVAAGGTHDDWDTYDRVMREEGRAAVLISPTRVYSNPAR